MMSLPKMGIKGNSHMLMQDRNNIQLADLILDWIDGHVESQEKEPLTSDLHWEHACLFSSRSDKKR